jgi:methylated-DNA-[protein]-cysteine S-methyltransferase
MLATASVQTPHGTFVLTAEDDEIIHAAWDRAPRTAANTTPVLRRARRWLDDYFAGDFRAVDFSVRAEGTHFQRNIWAAIAAIPAGATRTYGDIARELKSAPRAVGGVCGANPVAILIPCHRVLAADGGLGGYSGGRGVVTKRALLGHEGIAAGRAPIPSEMRLLA